MNLFLKSLILWDFANNNEFQGEGLNQPTFFQFMSYVGATTNSENVEKNIFVRYSRLGVMPVR